MTWKDEHTIQLENGREIPCPGGVIGLDAASKKVFVGYDDPMAPNKGDKPLSKEEWIEIADHQVRRWQEFKKNISGGT